MERVSESVAVSATPPSGGRPRFFESPVAEARMRLMTGDLATGRTAQNRAYAGIAIRTLGTSKELAWLGLGSRKQFLKGEARMTVLTELGRLRSGEAIRAAAVAVCEAKPRTTRLAAAFVRRWRLFEGGLPFDLVTLVNDLLKRCRDYYVDHPGMDWSDVAQALSMTIDQLPRHRRAVADDE